MSSGRRRVLVVSYRFPPHGGGGVQRTAYFVRYLREFGWEPHVLTGPLGRRSLEDDDLMGILPPGLAVTRSGHLGTDVAFRALRRVGAAKAARKVTPTLPSMEAGWIPAAVRAGRAIIETQRPDLIFSSSYPLASHCVAGILSRSSGLPWVADYRDEWSTRDVLPWPTPLHRRLARVIDGWVITRANHVVTTSPRHTENLAREFAGGRTNRFSTITNGYDHPDFEGPAPAIAMARSGPFELTHVGSVFRWRGAGSVLEAATRLIDSTRIGDFVLNFVGNASGLESGRPLPAFVNEVGYVSHTDAVAWMRRSTALLLINTETTNILGKTFEYLASGRPIIAAVRDGPTADLVRDTGAGPVVSPDDADAIGAAISTMYDCWTHGELVARDVSGVRRYSRRELTLRLAATLDAAAEGL